jgi:hypothetical protein
VASIAKVRFCIVDMLWKRYWTHKNGRVERELLVETVIRYKFREIVIWNLVLG